MIECPECKHEILAMNPKHLTNKEMIDYFCPGCEWSFVQYPDTGETPPEWAKGLGNQKHPEVDFCCSKPLPNVELNQIFNLMKSVYEGHGYDYSKFKKYAIENDGIYELFILWNEFNSSGDIENRDGCVRDIFNLLVDYLD